MLSLGCLLLILRLTAATCAAGRRAPEPVKVYDNTYHLGPKEGERYEQPTASGRLAGAALLARRGCTAGGRSRAGASIAAGEVQDDRLGIWDHTLPFRISDG